MTLEVIIPNVTLQTEKGRTVVIDEPGTTSFFCWVVPERSRTCVLLPGGLSMGFGTSHDGPVNPVSISPGPALCLPSSAIVNKVRSRHVCSLK